MRHFLTRILPELIRIRITLSVALSAFVGGVLALGKISATLFVPLAGIFLIACGASVLNQLQEKTEDAIMNRTKNRPLPSGDLSPQNALLITILLLFSGFAILALAHLLVCIILGILNILWYNGCYTFLKKKTAFAVVPGAISGVLPVYMGWSIAGGELADPLVFKLAFFLFIWQIPHFWLLMLRYGDEYHAAGFPVMTELFTTRQFRNIIFAWMIAAAATSIFLALSGIWITLFSKLFIIIFSLILLSVFFYQLMIAQNQRFKLLFITMNAFLLLVLSFVIFERILI